MSHTIRVAFALIAGMLMPVMTHAATLYIDPEMGKYGPGDTFVASVRLDNDDECINAGQIEVTYPTDRLRAVDFSRGGSIFNLWIQEPKLDTNRGVVSFSGGTPGGYCGRIPGDPALTNVLGKIVFTVMQTDAKEAHVDISPLSEVYLNDGMGTKAALVVRGSVITILPAATGAQNPWLKEVGEDTTAPDPFTIQVESTRDVFGGAYYAVFSTIDKQSGVDHYEISERGAWRTITSPYKLADQSLKDIRIKAIDKAGNERLGEYIEGSAPPSQAPRYDLATLLALFAILIVLASIKIYMDRKKKAEDNTLDLRS